MLKIVGLYLTSGGQNYPMIRKTPEEIINLRQASATQSNPANFYAVAGSNLLMVWPTPAASGTITAYYVPSPATLASGNDTPSEIPTEFHKLVEWYALAEAADYDDDGSSGMGAQYLARYEKGIAEAKKAVSRKGGNRLAPNIPGRRTRVSPSVPSQDLG